MSAEFEAFLNKSGIRHIASVPFHLSTNGLVEHAIQILKKRLKITDGSVKSRLAQVLLAFRITPRVRLEYHLLTCTRLHCLKPKLADHVERHQKRWKGVHDRAAHSRPFQCDNMVYVRKFWLWTEVVTWCGYFRSSILLCSVEWSCMEKVHVYQDRWDRD